MDDLGPDQVLAFEFVEMVIAKWRALGQSPLPLAQPLLLAVLENLGTNGLSPAEAAGVLRRLADAVEAENVDASWEALFGGALAEPAEPAEPAKPH